MANTFTARYAGVVGSPGAAAAAADQADLDFVTAIGMHRIESMLRLAVRALQPRRCF